MPSEIFFEAINKTLPKSKMRKINVHDCISGKNSEVESMNRIQEIEVVHSLRGLTFSHEDPPKC